MNILFLSNDPLLFDEKSAVRARMKRYAERIGTLHIISRGPRTAQAVVDGPLSLYPLHGGPFAVFHTLPKRAAELVHAKGVELISAQDPFEYGRAAFLASRATGVPYHLQVHTDFLSPWFVRSGVVRAMRVRMPFMNRVRQKIANWTLPSASGIRVVSERVRESLVKRYRASIAPPSVIPVEVGVATPPAIAFPAPAFPFSFLTIGRLEPEKRIEDILFALARIKMNYPSAGLYIVGDGSERNRLMRLCDKLGLKERVVFLGTRSDARALLPSAQAYIHASAYEGYGLTLVEAALARVPIITTDVGIVGEVFKGFTDVLSAPPGDPLQLAIHMASIIQDHTLRKTLPMNAEHAVRNHLATHPDQPGEIVEDLARALAAGRREA